MNQIAVFDCEYFDEKVLIYPCLIQTIYKAVFECEEMYFYHIQFFCSGAALSDFPALFSFKLHSFPVYILL